jgi:hypothetical protein
MIDENNKKNWGKKFEMWKKLYKLVPIYYLPDTQ